MLFLIFCLYLGFVMAGGSGDVYYDLIHAEWNTFKLEYDKNYISTIEDNYRLQIFMANKKAILEHNQKYALGYKTFKMSLNQFGDMTEEEVNKMMNGVDIELLEADWYDNSDNSIWFMTPENVDIPDSVNWITDGAVTDVKDQGSCGSCYAFSAIGSLEGQHFRATGNLTSLSEQNALDCSSKYGNKGCSGGWMDNVFQYIIDNKGIDTETDYPYKARTTKCHYKPEESGATMKNIGKITAGSEQNLKEAVATCGPISVAINASKRSFHFYSGGIYYEKRCGGTRNVDHAVLVVGYGTENGVDYWLVKNSWGKKWGDHGYIKMARNRNDNCCIACFASYPLV